VAIKNAENYVSVKYQRAPATVIAAEYVDLVRVIGTADGGKDGNLDSLRKLLEIEQHLAAGHELFHKRKYQHALDEYKLAQASSFQLLNPPFPKGVAIRPDLVFPIEPGMFAPMLSASLSFVEAMEPKSIEADFGATVDIPDEAIKPLVSFSDMGVDLVSDVSREARSDSRLASAYADRGQWTRAQFFFERAERHLERVQSPEATVARSAIALSLGGVLVQMGNTGQAREALARAAEGFRSVDDIVGLAQTDLNLAAAFAKEGNHDEAAPLLANAQKLITAAQGLPEAATKEDVRSNRPNPLDEVNPRPAFNPSLVEASVAAAVDARLAGTRLAIGQAAMLSAGSTLTPALRTTSVEPGSLSESARKQGLAVTFRQPEKGGGWTTQAVESAVETAERSVVKELGLLVGDEVAKIQWNPGEAIDGDQVIDAYYKRRVDLGRIGDVWGRWDVPSDLAVNLPHIYFYVLPISLGDCYHELGDYEAAQTNYLKAADYEFINTTLEVPSLWQRLARNVLDWGDRFYRADEFELAVTTYRTVLEPPGGVAVVAPDSPLYAHGKLKIVGDAVAAMLTGLDVNGAGALNPVLAAIVLEIRARLIQLNAGLDFLGMPATIVPIWSFDFLQNVARYFTQQAVQAEREFINWWDRAENEELTRQQLQQAVTQADAERELAREQREAAQAEETAYAAGEQLAQLRATNAAQNRTDYSGMSWDRIWLQQSMAWYSSQNPWERNNPIPGNGPDAGKEIHQVMAEKTERLQKITRDYELASMQRQVDELNVARAVAADQRAAATARVEAARQMEVVADLRRSAAVDNVASFDSQFFTPDVWYQMGAFMRSISNHYLSMAIKVARLMQRAYNFENDFDRHFIKVNYSTNAVKGLLGADALLLDIDSFTFDLITAVTRKRMPVKHTISLAERYPFLFETALRQTGLLEFETRIEDFDLAFPGTYQRRLERVEVEVDGVLPAAGVRGVLTNGGISRDRTLDINTIKFRIQPKESLVLSEHRIRDDAFVFPADPSRLGVFEGAGVAGTWTLELPRASNDLDYRAISDVRLVFYYQASFDQNLATAVKAQLATFTGVNLHAHTLPLRWTFPDAFFYFQDTGQLAFSVTPLDFPYNELDPQLKHLSVVVVPDPGVDPSPWTVRLGTPAHAATIAASPGADGSITADVGHPWEPLVTGAASGDYLLEIRANENPGLVIDGKLALDPIQNIVVVFEYSFTPRA
jgi:tetratricopeptide (TPR) repeat protein